MTCPDIDCVVQVVSQFVSNPHKNHLIVVHRNLRYISGTAHKELFYSSSFPLCLKSYADANWAGCPNTRRSTTDWYILILKNISYIL